MENETNASFGLPPAATAGSGALPPAIAAALDASVPNQVAPVKADETDAQRMERLRAKAEAAAAAEFDEGAVYAKLLAEARARRLEQLEKSVDLPTDTQGFPAEYVKVLIFKGQTKNDLSYVPLSIGGFCIKAPRGEEIILPKVFVTECLDHAVEEVTVQSQGGLITRPAHRFPYNTLGSATPAEYDAFRAGQRALAERQTARA